MGAGARATHPSDRRTWPRSTRRTMEGSIAWMWTGEGVCVCLIVSECRKFCRQSKECVRKGTKEGICSKGQRKECVWKGTQEKGCVRKGTKEGMCSQKDNGRNVFGKGHKKGCGPFLMRVGTCKGTQGKVFANMSAGADTKANTLELVRVPSSLLQRLQCGVALESLCDRGCSFGTEPVVLKTAAGGVRRWGGAPCQRALTQKANTLGRRRTPG